MQPRFSVGKRNETIRVGKWRNVVSEHGVNRRNRGERNARADCELAQKGDMKNDQREEVDQDKGCAWRKSSIFIRKD